MVMADVHLENLADDVARESLYRIMSVLIRGPYASAWHQMISSENLGVACNAAALLESHCPGISSSFANIAEELYNPYSLLCSEFDRVFGFLVPKECPPYETEFYPSTEVFARAQQMADGAGFYRAFGIEPARHEPDRPDHLGLQLEFMAFLLMKSRIAKTSSNPEPEVLDRANRCLHAQRLFFRDHLAWWLPSFASGLERKAGLGLYAALGQVFRAWTPSECRRLEIEQVLRPVQPDLIDHSEQQSGCATCPINV